MSFLNDDLPYILEVAGGELVVAPCSEVDDGSYNPSRRRRRDSRRLFQIWKGDFDWLN